MMPFKSAKALADRIVELLEPHCTRVDIAGSIRRGRPEVKDIEIVCVPKRKFIQTDLLGGGHWQTIEPFRITLQLITDHVVKGNAEGRYMQIVLKGGATLDLFMPVEADYFRQLAIRTGSADYSAFVIAHGWKKAGWVGTHDGLRRQEQCRQNEKSRNWVCIVRDPELPPVWASEQEFFAWIGVEWTAPEKREYKQALNLAQ